MWQDFWKNPLLVPFCMVSPPSYNAWWCRTCGLKWLISTGTLNCVVHRVGLGQGIHVSFVRWKWLSWKGILNWRTFHGKTFWIEELFMGRHFEREVSHNLAISNDSRLTAKKDRKMPYTEPCLQMNFEQLSIRRRRKTGLIPDPCSADYTQTCAASTQDRIFLILICLDCNQDGRTSEFLARAWL